LETEVIDKKRILVVVLLVLCVLILTHVIQLDVLTCISNSLKCERLCISWRLGMLYKLELFITFSRWQMIWGQRLQEECPNSVIYCPTSSS